MLSTRAYVRQMQLLHPNFTTSLQRPGEQNDKANIASILKISIPFDGNRTIHISIHCNAHEDIRVLTTYPVLMKRGDQRVLYRQSRGNSLFSVRVVKM